jgi:hypothetical protein
VDKHNFRTNHHKVERRSFRLSSFSLQPNKVRQPPTNTLSTEGRPTQMGGAVRGTGGMECRYLGAGAEDPVWRGMAHTIPQTGKKYGFSTVGILLCTVVSLLLTVWHAFQCTLPSATALVFADAGNSFSTGRWTRG